MRSLTLAVVLLAATGAQAASYTLTWQQEPGLVAESTKIERANATGRVCGTYVEIASVAPTVLSFVDANAPAGIVCYRVRNHDGLTLYSDYSNVAAAPRTAPPKQLDAR